MCAPPKSRDPGSSGGGAGEDPSRVECGPEGETWARQHQPKVTAGPCRWRAGWNRRTWPTASRPAGPGPHPATRPHPRLHPREGGRDKISGAGLAWRFLVEWPFLIFSLAFDVADVGIVSESWQSYNISSRHPHCTTKRAVSYQVSKCIALQIRFCLKRRIQAAMPCEVRIPARSSV